VKNNEETSFKYKRILVPFDGSVLAEKALLPAVNIAESMASEVICLRVITDLTINLDPRLNQQLIEARENAASIYLNSLRHRFSKTKTHINVSTVIGSPAKTIINYAKEHGIDLIVITSHGHTGLKQWVYGSVAIKILRQAPCDTLLIRPLIGANLFSNNRILVPLDGSQLAERALQPALALAAARNMAILLLRVSPPIYAELEPMSMRSMFDDIEAKGRKEAKAYLQNLSATLAPFDIPVTVETMTGTPAAAILDYANKQQVDMIIMSSHGRTGPGLWLMGSVSEKVLRKATCSTLIVRAS